MSLSLVLRNAAKPRGFQSLLKGTPIILNNVAKFTQFTPRTSLVQKCAKIAPNVLVPVSKRMMSQDHSFMWSVEKAVSGSLFFVVPLGIIAPNLLLDTLMAVLVTAHSHWGIEAIVLDYVRPIIFGPAIPKLAHTMVYVISAITLGGLMYFNFTNIGIGKSVHRLWHGKGN